MSQTPTRILLVEGQEDMRVIPWLVEKAGVPWGPRASPIVTIQPYDGVDALLAPGQIETWLKRSELASLGVIVDADNDASARWQAIRARIERSYRDVPQFISADGLVIRQDGRPTFGAWIMPDNVNRGMLETFLLHLQPTENKALLDLATRVVAEAQTLGAPFSEAHSDKARIHSWLAWQDPPGRQLHNAIIESMLRPDGPFVDAFLEWFCRLFSLPSRTSRQ